MLSPDEFFGEGYTIRDEKKHRFEVLHIRKTADKVQYSAMVEGQNDGVAVIFKMLQYSDSLFIVANPEHDFPKRIEYKKESDIRIPVTLTGSDEQSPYRFWFVREELCFLSSRHLPFFISPHDVRNPNIWL